VTDSDPIARVEALPFKDRVTAALDADVLTLAASLDVNSLEFARVRARLRGCMAISKDWDAAVDALRPKVCDARLPPGEAWTREFRLGENDAPTPSPLNAGLILRNWPPFASLRLNELTLEAELEAATWRDGDTFRWQERIERTFGVSFSKDTLDSAIEAVAEERAFHPMRERIDAVRWDGVRRIPHVAADILDCHDPLAERMIECFLIGAVARIYKPGEKVDSILTLFSADQGRKKSTFFDVLAYERHAYIGPFDPSNKDHVMYAATSIFNVLDECDELTGRMEWPAIKRFASMRADTFRPPYGRRPRRFPRGFVNVATTNKNDFLRDETGSRRWHILAVGNADPIARMAKLEAWRDLLWAEAKELWLGGTSQGTQKPEPFLWWLTPDEETQREEGAKAYEERSVLDEKLEAYLARQGKGAEVRMQDVLAEIGVVADKIATAGKEEKAAGRVLRRLGWVPGETSMLGQRHRVWRKK
jgi:putative DNA primase/helicase